MLTMGKHMIPETGYISSMCFRKLDNLLKTIKKNKVGYRSYEMMWTIFRDIIED